MSVKIYDLMGRGVVQCGRKMPKAEEPAAWVLIELFVTVCEDLNFHPLSCVIVNIACRSLSVWRGFSEITFNDLFQHKRFCNWLVWTKGHFVWQYLI